MHAWQQQIGSTWSDCGLHVSLIELMNRRFRISDDLQIMAVGERL